MLLTIDPDPGTCEYKYEPRLIEDEGDLWTEVGCSHPSQRYLVSHLAEGVREYSIVDLCTTHINESEDRAESLHLDPSVDLLPHSEHLSKDAAMVASFHLITR